MKLTVNLILAMGVVLSVVGCSDSDKEEPKKQVAYVQYYNASPDSTSTNLVLKSKKYTSVNFGQAIQRFAVTTGSNEVSVTGKNAENKDVSFHKQDVTFAAGDNHLYVLAGDYAKTDFVDIKFTTDKLDKENDNEDKKTYMQVLGAHVSKSTAKLGIYIGKKEDGFSSAKFLGQAEYKGVTESQILETGKYVVYLTKAGSNEPFYTTAEVNLNAKTVYKLLVRPGFGAATEGIKLDAVSGGKSVSSLPDINEKVQFRVYNGFEETDKVKAELKGKSGESHEVEVARWAISSFTPAKFGDYDVEISDAATGNTLLNNLLVTYNQSDSKSILLYPDAEDKLKATVIEHSLTPRSYQYSIQLLNLAAGTKGLEVYFVRGNETVETAKYKVTKWDFTKNLSITLPRDSYTVTVIKRENDNTLNLLHRQALQLKDNLDFTLVLTPDESQTWGYRLVAFQ
ncbi:DUF4397 domain-containing protein [Shewanella submarina]|uniref:DUF4397 domain-containing protein n=1 Tax=Shewanella submarina TaxID=2016376 RepID=A0ABV7GG18_9GAMM|nr:DUF4397 domain-containing protein [Shewanella submarina]